MGLGIFNQEYFRVFVMDDRRFCSRQTGICLLCVLFVVLLCLLSGCTARTGTVPDLGRAHPGYVQWLERQSMLRASPELATIVSGSSLGWRASSTVSDALSLLDQADIWLEFRPRLAAWAGSAPALEVLADAAPSLAGLGISGLYLSESHESGSDQDAESLTFAPVSLGFAPAVGNDEDYAALELRAAEAGLLLGGDSIPTVTGLGPDFLLAIRGLRHYPGLYIMTEVPPACWPLLPSSSEQMLALSSPQTAELARRHIIPPAFARDLVPGRQGGWAVTPEISGVDGITRRWLYRWTDSPTQAVLNWQDPSLAARRVLSASVIRQAGVLHQPLIGLSVDALWGQETALPTIHTDINDMNNAGPALPALRDLGRDVRRYGAWSLLRDALPLRLIPAVQKDGPDFVRDTVTFPALEYALLSGDATVLNRALQASLAVDIDHSRLWRTPADGIALAVPPAPELEGSLSSAWHDVPFPTGSKSRLEAMTVAATAAGLEPDDIADLKRGLRMPIMTETDKERIFTLRDRVRAAHILQIAFRALQPGLLMVRGQDLTGTLPEPDQGLTAWLPNASSAMFSHQGLPAEQGIYGSLAVQRTEQHSFGHVLSLLSALRRRTGLAKGKAVAVPVMTHRSVAGLLSRLPDGDLLLCAGNVSGSSLVVGASLPPGLIRAGEPGLDLVTGRGVAVGKDRLRLRMEPWGWRAILLRRADMPPASEPARSQMLPPVLSY